MKKKMSTKGMMILAVGIAMASCSKNDVFEQNQTNFSEQQKAEYVSNYVAKYGQPDANQSWDFAAAVPNASKTRAGETMVCDPANNPSLFYWNVMTDLHKPITHSIENMIKSATVKKWNPYLKVELYPSAVHTTGTALKFALSVCYNDEVSNIVTGFKANDKSWGYNLDFLGDYLTASVYSVGRNVDTRSLTTAENVYWAAYSYNYEWKWRTFISGEWVEKGLKSFELKTYKEITVNGHTYWCFDCTGDGDYSNLICLAVDAETQAIQKRYFVEDLGSKDDFDFNDIVFDVIDDNGSQECIVRAMGGTLDFTLKIGDTTWTKSEAADVKTMYNTQGNIEYDKVLARFPVTGWNPNANNISVEVKSNVSENVIIKIPFPKKGEVPMILAFKTVTNWQTERESLPEGWWFTPIEISED
jgi:hypothetical protein